MGMSGMDMSSGSTGEGCHGTVNNKKLTLEIMFMCTFGKNKNTLRIKFYSCYA